MAHRTAYRVRQFFGSLLARVSKDDLRQADAHLSPGAQKLFRRMPAADQRHGLAVMRALERAGQAHPAVLAAALLHDVGKSGAGLTPVHRTIVVVLQHFWPAALAWLAREPTGGDPSGLAGVTAAGWRRPFVIHRCHPAVGAGWAEQAGCDATSVMLIRRHQEPVITRPQDDDDEDVERWLAQLQQADRDH